jgi:predicted ATPase
MALPASGELQRYLFIRKGWPGFVGRQAQLQRFKELWTETRQGRGQVILVKGASGLGKSRLVQELIDGLDEATLLIGRCHKDEGSPAYQPFISALKTYFENVRPEVADKHLGPVWREVIELLPEMGKIVHGPTFASSSDGPTPATPVTFLQALAQATAKHPWLLVLDDLQWADYRSLRLLNFLGRYCTGMALMIIGLYRDDELEPNSAFSEAIDPLSQASNFTILGLDPLAEPEVKTLLENIWLQPVPDDLVTALFQRSQGHPLFAETLALSLMDEGLVSWRDDRWHFGPVVEANLPQQLGEAILRRISLLSRETQALLQQAAILGPSFSVEDLQGMSNLSINELLDCLDTALERQLLKEPPGEQRLQFSHGTTQQVLYESLSALKQRLLHREAAEALERQHALNIREMAPLLAAHFFQAGELERGLTYSIQAASGANAVYTHQNALYWYSRALDVIEQLDEEHSTHYQRFELLLARERIYNDLGLRQAQLADLKALQALAQELKEPAKQAQIHNRQSAYEYLMGHLTEASTEAQAGLIAARLANNAVLESKSLIQLADIALHHGQFETARDHLQTAQTQLKRVSHQRAEASVLNGFGGLYKQLYDYIEAETCYQHALAVSQFLDDRAGQALYLSNLADLLLKKGHYTLARSYQHQALIINRIIGKGQGEAACLNRLAALYIELGRYDQALEYVQEAKLLHSQIEDELGLAEDLRLHGAIIRLSTQDYLTARDYLGQALEIFQRLKNKPHQLITWLEIGLSFEAMGDFNKAGNAYEQAQLLSGEMGYPLDNFDARAGIARCLLSEGKVEEAQQQLQNCLDALPGNALYGVQYPVRFYLTLDQLLQQAGQPQQAQAMLQAGQALLQRRLEHIDEPALRDSFLNNVSDNKTLLAQLGQ